MIKRGDLWTSAAEKLRPEESQARSSERSPHKFLARVAAQQQSETQEQHQECAKHPEQI